MQGSLSFLYLAYHLEPITRSYAGEASRHQGELGKAGEGVLQFRGHHAILCA